MTLLRKRAHFMECYHCGYRVISDNKKSAELHMALHITNSHDMDFTEDCVIRGYIPIEDYEFRKELKNLGSKMPVTVL